MRVKRQKQVRRRVRFYKACCGFREPFRVLCDGKFVHDCLSARVGSLQDALSSLLGGSTKPTVTRCVVGELRKLGKEFSGAVIAARRLDTAKCEHDPHLPGVDCLKELVGSTNSDHYYVATQELQLRKKLRKVPGGGIIFLRNTGLILEPPSALQLAHARLSEAERLHLASREEKVLKQRTKQKLAQAAGGGGDDTDPSLFEGALDEEGQEKQTLRLKRTRAKAPNPLSQKKKSKKSTEDIHPKGPSKEEVAGDDSMKKTKRQRHRVRRHKKADGETPQ